MNESADILDKAIPLNGASHRDVVDYSVDTPMRYSECYAALADGRKVRFQDAGRFLGWCGNGEHNCFLFESEGRRLLLRKVDSTWQAVVNEHLERRQNQVKKFIARDGSLLFVRLANWALELPRERRLESRRQVLSYAVDGMAHGAPA